MTLPRVPGAQVALQALGQPRRRAARAVVLIHGAGEHGGLTAAQGHRIDAGILDRLPRDLQQQTLLRVHRERLARADAKEVRVERARVVQEAGPSRVLEVPRGRGSGS